MEQPSLIVIGASARAAAWSALRAGFVPWCIDLFADVDLQATAHVEPCSIDHWPDGVEELLAAAPDVPWCYSGGLENYSALVDRLAKQRTLWGNDADALRRSRCPFTVVELLRNSGLPAVAAFKIDALTQVWERGNYLRKPFRGAAGLGIHVANDVPTSPDEAHYLQEFISGVPMSAAFATVGAVTHLLGITEQLIGETWLHAEEFRYCGNIGPVSVSPTCRDMLMRIGEVLAKGCGLRGLFGIDFILQDEVPYVVEVNPRYTASMELLEFSGSAPLFHLQCAAFEGTKVEYQSPPISPSGVLGKAILYAPQTMQVRGEYAAPFSVPTTPPLLADIPHNGETIQAGWPIVTIFALGCDVESCRGALQLRARETYAQLFLNRG